MAHDKINYQLSTTMLHNRFMVPPGCQPAGRGAVSVWVPGTPAPQGSKRYLGAAKPGGRMRAVESSKNLPAWRADVRAAFKDQLMTTRTPGVMAFAPYQPVMVKIVFVMPRPVATPKTRPTPAAVRKPDIDKLERAVLDALTSAGLWGDDAQVVTVHKHKRIAERGEPTGAMIHVEPAAPRWVGGSGECAHGGYQSQCGVLGGHGNGASLPSAPALDVE